MNMDKDISFHDDWRLTFLSGLSKGLRDMQRSGQYCDVTINVEGVMFRCHKVVLCAVSPYFAAMFSHDMKESRDSTVVLHDTRAGLFEQVLNCIYDGDDVITDDNAQDVLEIAGLMQIEMILDKCESFFAEKLTVENFIDVLYMAKKYNCQRLEGFVWKFMLDNFASLCLTDDLSLLPLETIVALLVDDNLAADNEESVCNTAVKWLMTDIDSREQHAGKLFGAIRLPLCSPEYIIHRFNLNQNERLRTIPEINDAIQEAFRFRMCLSQRQNYSSLQTTYRKTSKHDDVMIVIGGTDISGNAGTGMRCYSFLREKWHSLPAVPDNIGPQFAMCTYGDDVYISGGQYHREAFHKFQSSSCSWVAMTKMVIGRYQHAMLAVSDAIYVIGGDGTDTKSISKFHIQSGKWEQSCELLRHVTHVSAAAVNQDILIFGGKEKDLDASNGIGIQCYNTFSKQISIITTIGGFRIGSDVISCEEDIHIITPDGYVSKIAADKETKAIGRIEDFNSQKFSMIQFRGNLYSVVESETNNTAKGLHSWQSDDKFSLRVVDLHSLQVKNVFRIPSSGQGRLPWLCNSSRLACAKISIAAHHLERCDVEQSVSQ